MIQTNQVSNMTPAFQIQTTITLDGLQIRLRQPNKNLSPTLQVFISNDDFQAELSKYFECLEELEANIHNHHYSVDQKQNTFSVIVVIQLMGASAPKRFSPARFPITIRKRDFSQVLQNISSQFIKEQNMEDIKQQRLVAQLVQVIMAVVKEGENEKKQAENEVSQQLQKIQKLQSKQKKMEEQLNSLRNRMKEQKLSIMEMNERLNAIEVDQKEEVENDEIEEQDQRISNKTVVANKTKLIKKRLRTKTARVYKKRGRSKANKKQNEQNWLEMNTFHSKSVQIKQNIITTAHNPGRISFKQPIKSKYKFALQIQQIIQQIKVGIVDRQFRNSNKILSGLDFNTFVLFSNGNYYDGKVRKLDNKKGRFKSGDTVEVQVNLVQHQIKWNINGNTQLCIKSEKLRYKGQIEWVPIIFLSKFSTIVLYAQ